MAKRQTEFDPSSLSRTSAAANLRRAANRYGSTAEMSRKTNIPRTTLSRWLSGKSVPTHRSAERTAAALNRIHFKPPPQPPRHKAYTRAELAKIVVWSSAAGPNAITSKKLSQSKIDAAAAILSGEKHPRIVGENIKKIRQRFVASTAALSAGSVNERDAAFAAAQNAGSDWFGRFNLSDSGRAEFAQAFRDEIKTLFYDKGIALDSEAAGGPITIDNGSIPSNLVRRAGQFNVFMPAGFAQVFQFMQDIDTHGGGGYFSIDFNSNTGAITIWQSREQKPRPKRSRSDSKSSHRRSRE